MSFQEAVTAAQVPGFDEDYVYSCLDFFEDVEDPPPGLTVDEASALRLYTMETPFLGAFNRALRAREGSLAKPFFPFLQLCLIGVFKMQKYRGTLFRGSNKVPVRVIEEYKRKLESKKFVIWNSCSITTTTLSGLENDLFCGKSGSEVGTRAQFILQNCNIGVDLGGVTAGGEVPEVFLPPGLKLRVDSFVELDDGVVQFQLSYEGEISELVPPQEFLS